MKFAAVALFATGAFAALAPPPVDVEDKKPVEDKKKPHYPKYTTSTVYATVTHTDYDCPPEVTKCPKDKVKIVTETIAVSTTVCPVEETSTYKPVSTSSYKPHKPEETSTPCPEEEETSKYHPKPTYSEKPEKPECPVTKVKTISTSITTVIPTVVYETYTEDCPKPTYAPKPTGGCTGNCTKPEKPSKPVTAGAASMVGSAVFAAAAGIAAYAFA
jgi:hypothetical protein